jgi:hypothetical protein
VEEIASATCATCAGTYLPRSDTLSELLRGAKTPAIAEANGYRNAFWSLSNFVEPAARL